jgi:transcriptional regulator with XRE-family HTH domain
MTIEPRIRHLKNGSYLLGWEEIAAGRVAAIIGKTARYVRAVLTGKVSASLKTYRSLAGVLGLTIDALLSRVEAARELHRIPRTTDEYSDMITRRVSAAKRHTHKVEADTINHDGQTHKLPAKRR